MLAVEVLAFDTGGTILDWHSGLDGGLPQFDLDAARGEGYRTAFVLRPEEWGPAGPPDPVPNPACDLVVAGFAELADLPEA
jgi:hypothetical protein